MVTVIARPVEPPPLTHFLHRAIGDGHHRRTQATEDEVVDRIRLGQAMCAKEQEIGKEAAYAYFLACGFGAGFIGTTKLIATRFAGREREVAHLPISVLKLLAQRKVTDAQVDSILCDIEEGRLLPLVNDVLKRVSPNNKPYYVRQGPPARRVRQEPVTALPPVEEKKPIADGLNLLRQTLSVIHTAQRVFAEQRQELQERERALASHEDQLRTVEEQLTTLNIELLKKGVP